MPPDGGRRLMSADSSWDIVPVANPALSDRKLRRLIRRSFGYDPIGVAQPRCQLRHRDELVLPSALDRMSRELLIRAQTAIDSAIDSVADDAVESADIVTEPMLRWHEWQIAFALRDITDLRAEHEYNASSSAGPMTDSVLEPQRRACD
jgi:hypothetical protein